MLQISDIELPHTAISTHRSKYISLSGEVDIVDLFIMGDELCENCLLLYVPDSASSVNGTGANQIGHLWVPVK